MNELVVNFKDNFLLRLSTEYNQGIIEMVSDAPKSIVNFNNVTVLKKAQKYIRHTDLVFNKAVSKLFYNIFQEKQVDCSIGQDRHGRCIYIKKEQRYIHFMPQEKLIGFPNVPWYKEFNKEKDRIIWNTYVVLIENSSNAQTYVCNMNSKVNTRNKFVTIEEFTTLYFGKELWEDISIALKNIETESKKYKWFDLANICTTLNKEEFLKQLEETLVNFDYKKEISKCNLSIDSESELHDKYIINKSFKIMLGLEDFSISFFTSEWMFNNYFYDDCLDKTYVIAGYLKSIEQLLIYCINKTGTESKISVPAKGGKFKNISIQSEDFYKATLGNIIFFLKQYENRDVFSKSVSFSSIKAIVKIIADWVQRERNGYFHKHNIDNINTVESVRARTLLLYYLILGSINMKG